MSAKNTKWLDANIYSSKHLTRLVLTIKSHFVIIGVNMKTLEKAINIVGSVTELAKMLGISQSAVSNWKARGFVPLDFCQPIEIATKSKVRCEEIRSDVTWIRDYTGITGYLVPIKPRNKPKRYPKAA